MIKTNKMSNTSPSQLVNGDDNNTTEILDYIDFTEVDDNNQSTSVIDNTTIQIDNLTCDYTESLSSLSSSSSSIININNCKLGNKITTGGAAAAAYNMVAAMNEHLSSSSATNNTRKTIGHSGDFNSTIDTEDVKPPPPGILTFPCDFDHMYASMTDSGTQQSNNNSSNNENNLTIGVSPLRGNEQRTNENAEVKHLKELLLLHLDLIQQQSEQIVTKDKILAALRQENEMLKLRLERMDRRVNLQKLRSESTENSVASDNTGPCSPPNLHSVSGDHKNTQSDGSSPQYNETFKIRLNTSGGITTVKQEPSDSSNTTKQVEVANNSEPRLDWENKKKRRSDTTTVHNSTSKRKRGVSCSSTISNDTSSTNPEAKGHEARKEKKGKSIIKKESFLTTEEHYYTVIGEPNFGLSIKTIKNEEDEDSNNLEVPNWRVKIYTSCYTMEGTENLDDEIFNKRHHKLENDERRRKRWDVQRIREQRHIEKLKQRQERQNHQATCYNTNHTGPCPSGPEEESITTLWPEIDQIQSLQVDPQLPVAAFGAPIPSFNSSEFSLPWLHTARVKSRRQKRSSSGRRKSRR